MIHRTSIAPTIFISRSLMLPALFGLCFSFAILNGGELRAEQPQPEQMNLARGAVTPKVSESKPKKFESLTIPPLAEDNTSSSFATAIRHFRELLPRGDALPDWTAIKEGAVDLLEELSEGEIEDVSRYFSDTDYGVIADDFQRWFSNTAESAVDGANRYGLTDVQELERGLRSLILGDSMKREDLSKLDSVLERLSKPAETSKTSALKSRTR